MGVAVVIRSGYITQRVLQLVPGLSEPSMTFDRSGVAGWFAGTIDGKRRSCAWWRQQTAWTAILDDDEIAAHIVEELQK